MATPIA